MFSIPFTTKRSVEIERPASQVFKYIGDFSTWATWSPWICQEPGCPVDISGEPMKPGHHQKWDGQRIGSGEMKIVSSDPDRKLEYDLHFLKPWKSHSKTAFKLTETDGKTTVSWSMHGTLPLFLFFMKKMMSAWVGSDYDRGLSMLKELVETDQVHSLTTIKGITDQKEFHYMGIRKECANEDVGDLMEQVFEDLTKQLSGLNTPRPDFFFSFYHKFDLVHGQCEFLSGAGFWAHKPVKHPDLETGSVEAHRAATVEHKGAYRHLGNGWSTIMSYEREKKIKKNKSIPMYEIYRNHPSDTSEESLLTDIFLPIR